MTIFILRQNEDNRVHYLELEQAGGNTEDTSTAPPAEENVYYLFGKQTSVRRRKETKPPAAVQENDGESKARKSNKKKIILIACAVVAVGVVGIVINGIEMFPNSRSPTEVVPFSNILSPRAEPPRPRSFVKQM
eukprot:CAMPEP_0194042542 /NCGR_PEP_ID=MMETSP0009_2-20130614/14306_1 /TAXON_ID=210454 /ORGANISM="Grammatophora oceanica, Strain CCMP 410" /LENGTH=133 /DNA_ID=CAMNT_0038686421 /DNA_START=22 /DNA_END=420 /DNA_ORIENTATION=-